MADQMIHVHNNTANPIAFAFTVGDRNREIRMETGWNAIEPGPLDRVTGGFDDKGIARGGLIAYLFNKPIKIGSRIQPRLELGTPRPSDTVHQCPSVPGVRRHHRTLKAEKDAQERRAILSLLEQTTRELAAAKGGGDGLVEVNLGNGIKARMSLADAQAYAAQQGTAPEVDADVPEPGVWVPFDPSTMTIKALTEAVGSIEDPDVMTGLIKAEVDGKNRAGAVEALTEALAILEA